MSSLPAVLAMTAANLSLERHPSIEPPAELPEEMPWLVKEGPCPVDCSTNFYIFLSIVCLLKFSGATGRTSNFLVSVR